MNASKNTRAIVAILVVVAGVGLWLGRNGGGVLAQPRDPETGPGMAPVQDLFHNDCVRCHGTASPAASLDLSPENAHGQLVGRPSLQAPSLLRVQPGVPEDSYLFLKIAEGRQHLERGGRGRRMPLGAPPLAGPQIRLVEDWIRSGAAP